MQKLSWLLALVVLGCATHRYDQAVTRYTLDLSRPDARIGERCWDQCLAKGLESSGECLASCPGVEARLGEACVSDPRDEEASVLCHTHVFSTREPDEGPTNGEIVAAVARTAFEVSKIVLEEEASQSSSESSTEEAGETSAGAAPARTPAQPKAQSNRNHRVRR